MAPALRDFEELSVCVRVTSEVALVALDSVSDIMFDWESNIGCERESGTDSESKSDVDWESDVDVDVDCKSVVDSDVGVDVDCESGVDAKSGVHSVHIAHVCPVTTVQANAHVFQ